MSASPANNWDHRLDLTAPPTLASASERLERTAVGLDVSRALESLTSEEQKTERARRLTETLRRLDTGEIVGLLLASGRESLRLEPAGLRFLFDFLEVKRPGVEVLRQLEGLSSMERISLQIVGRTWTEPEESADNNSVFPLLEVLEEATHAGVLDLGIDTLPRRPEALRALYAHLRRWFAVMRDALERGERLPEPFLHLITQISMLEISFLEKRLSKIASSIDPYDVRGMGRLMPVLSRYDQDIEHMKSVVSRLVTYRPFHDRFLTIEHALSSSEMEKIARGLGRNPDGESVARVLASVRERPMLDRPLAFLVSLVHQIALLRAEHLLGSDTPDLLSTVYRILEAGHGEPVVNIRMEPGVADALWPTLDTWGVLRRGPDALEVRYREDRAVEFINVDGTPRLPSDPGTRTLPELSLRELVRSQLNNDAFILGVLDNPKAVNMPGTVELIAQQTRSLRVLDRICRSKSLHTGSANRGVPRELLLNPARIPLTQIRRFIHVRFVNKNDLRKMARPHANLRNEVRKEVETYVRTLEQ